MNNDRLLYRFIIHLYVKLCSKQIKFLDKTVIKLRIKNSTSTTINNSI